VGGAHLTCGDRSRSWANMMSGDRSFSWALYCCDHGLVFGGDLFNLFVAPILMMDAPSDIGFEVSEIRKCVTDEPDDTPS